MIDMVAISVPFLRKFVTESVSGASFIDDRTLLERFGVDLEMFSAQVTQAETAAKAARRRKRA